MEILTNVAFVPVSLDEVERVSQFLTRLRAGGPPEGASSAQRPTNASSGFVDVPGQRRWFENEVEPLKDALPYPLLQQLIGLMVKNPDSWVAKHQAEDPNDPHTRIQLRNELGALTKACKRVHGSRAWPFEWKKERGTVYYRMNSRMALWWKKGS